jgi:hypothetical protein
MGACSTIAERSLPYANIGKKIRTKAPINKKW